MVTAVKIAALHIAAAALVCLFFIYQVGAREHHHGHQSYRHHHHHHRSSHRHTHRHTVHRMDATSSVGLAPTLAAKVNEIRRDCGSSLISAVRHTYVAGTRRLSCHASGEAADVSGNPSCIYNHLHDWHGGYSIDYSHVGHVHISVCSREAGAHFVHGGYTRHASRHHIHFAHAHGHRHASLSGPMWNGFQWK